VNSTDTLLTVSELLRDHTDLLSLPVLDQGIPKVVVRRHDLLELFSSQYGRSLNETKPVSKLLKKDFLIFESFISLASV
ncbi:GGDEF domain-containing protein, partial [Neptunomonas phycophila]|nr:GGDEF domain-containing protein [Neptunomonas phycophila]